MTDYASAGSEPNLAEMIADPVVQAVMRRDGVTETALWSVMSRAWTARRSELAGRERPGSIERQAPRSVVPAA